jgi:H+/Cl- antiporter ClcA
MSYPLDRYLRLLEESSGLFLILLVLASLILLATLVLCVAVWYATARGSGSREYTRAGLTGREAQV